MRGVCHKGWYYTMLEIKPEKSSYGTDIAAKDVWIPIKARVGALSKPDTNLDLDDVAATSPKAKAELDELKNRVMRLEQELEAYQTDHSHKCIVCRHCYTPQQGESEDCPVCGCDGTKGY